MEGQNDFEQLLGPYGPYQILLQTDALDAWQLTIQENDCIGLIQEELVEHLQLNSQKELKIIKIKETVICEIALMTRQSKTPIVQEVIRHFT